MRRALRLAVALAALLGAGWVLRHQLLERAGALLIAEDPIAPVDVIAVSNARPAEDAFEAAALFRRGVASRVIVPTAVRPPIDEDIRRLGIAFPSTPELVRGILERSGVPPGAITMLPGAVDGTTAEVAEIARFARERRPASLLFLTARSHTARARWLLRRQVPEGTRVLVRGADGDGFMPATWWHDRELGREAALEFLRWALLAVPSVGAPSTEPATATVATSHAE